MPKRILLIVCDSLRFDHITPSITPNLLRMGEEGVMKKIEAGGSTTEESLPVMLCSNKDYNPSDSIPSDLKELGFTSVLIHSNPLIKKFTEGWNFVLDVYPRRRLRKARRLARKFLPDWAIRLLKLQRKLGGRGPNEYLPYSRAEELLSLSLKINDEPSFFWIHLMDPHNPYYPRNSRLGHWELVRLNDLLLEAIHGHLNPPPQLVEIWRRLYRQEVSEMDAEIGKYYQALKIGGMKDALLLITADHGDEFGEHGEYGHRRGKRVPELVDVPLIVVGEGYEAFSEVESHWELRSALRQVAEG